MAKLEAKDTLTMFFVTLLTLTAQIELSSVYGKVIDSSGGSISGAQIVLYSTSNFEQQNTTNQFGEYHFEEIPFGAYRIRAVASGFRIHEQDISIQSNLRTHLEISLKLLGPSEVLTVRSTERPFGQHRITQSQRIDGLTLDRSLGTYETSGLQRLIATTPGWVSEDNGLLHSRGVDDGFLYIIDGMPTIERMDTLFSTAIDVDSIETIEILDGHLPVEYGLASGGVIRVTTKSGLNRPWNHNLSIRAASKHSGSVSTSFGGKLSDTLGVFTTGSYRGSRRRFLDPVDIENFNNRGSALQFFTRADWRANTKNLIIAKFSANRSNHTITNSLEQELAGQRASQNLDDNHESILWQKIWSDKTVTDLALYRHAFNSQLIPSEYDTPISAKQDRQHVRRSVLASFTHQAGVNLLKAGLEIQTLHPSEHFSFFITDETAAEEIGISAQARNFTRNNRFTFKDQKQGAYKSVYIQNTMLIANNLTVNAGLRLDQISFLVNDTALSPRLGMVYYLPTIRATFRSSYNRLFMPHQLENILLSSSTEARKLSPFTHTSVNDGGSELIPERQHAFDLGFAKKLGNAGLIDISYWHRDVINYADSNVFFGTTIIFPNSVYSGKATGINGKVELKPRTNFSVFLNYGNASVYQIGPINGGLFLEEEILEIEPGTKFTPDHDQRNVGVLGATYEHQETKIWTSVFLRHESGTPLEIETDEIENVMSRRGASLVDFDRMRVKPRTLLDFSMGGPLYQGRKFRADVQVDIRNAMNTSFAYNFSNPFSGTHFGHPRLVSLQVKIHFPTALQ